MYSQTSLEECCIDLCRHYSQSTALDFLQRVFPFGRSLTVSFSGSFDKYIFMYGNQQEVYSKRERRLLDRSRPIIVYRGADYSLQSSSINHVCLVVDLRRSTDIIYDCLLFMKITRKAFPAFHQYVFVFDDCIYFGCDSFSKQYLLDCELSVRITPNINWEVLLDLFSYIPETNDFRRFYTELCSALSSISDACTGDGEDDYGYYTDDSDDSVYFRRGLDWALLGSIPSYSKCESSDNDNTFAQEVFAVKEELSQIRSNRVNPFELLLDSEAIPEEDSEIHHDAEEAPEDVDNTAISLLDDPEALLKYLANKRG